MKNTTVSRIIKFMNVAPKHSMTSGICGIMFRDSKMYAADGPTACSVELIDEEINGFIPFDKFDIVKALYKGQKKNDQITGVSELLIENNSFPVKIEKYFPEKTSIKVAVNAKLLFNLFKALDDRDNVKMPETLILHINESLKPVGVETLGGNKGIIMPVKV